MAPALRVVDHGWEKFSSAVRRMADEHGVRVGVLGDTPQGGAQREGGMTNAEVAAANEFGTETIPERSFMRASFNTNRAEYIDMLGRLLVGCLEGKGSPERAFGLVGARIAADMKNFVTQGDEVPPPNAPATIERKLAKGSGGEPRTLVDTGSMVNALTWRVIGRGDVDEGGDE